eukprot:NODE_757_length_4524_cov_0.312768.p1 type:complete len:597 gc:universal NODE_757_length_4524_cov_0.312768:1231-3021(+)
MKQIEELYDSIPKCVKELKFGVDEDSLHLFANIDNMIEKIMESSKITNLRIFKGSTNSDLNKNQNFPSIKERCRKELKKDPEWTAYHVLLVVPNQTDVDVEGYVILLKDLLVRKFINLYDYSLHEKSLLSNKRRAYTPKSKTKKTGFLIFILFKLNINNSVSNMKDLSMIDAIDFPAENPFSGVVSQRLSAIVGVGNTKRITSTGLIISQHCVITALHCIQDADIASIQIWLNFELEEDYMTRIPTLYSPKCLIFADKDLDIAVLHISEYLDCKSFEFTMPKKEDELVLLHHPHGFPKVVSLGSVCKISEKYVFTDHHTNFGSSGGIYMDLQGNFISIHLSKQLGETKSILLSVIFNTIDILKEILKNRSLEFPKIESFDRIEQSSFFQSSRDDEDRPKCFPDFPKSNIAMANHHIIPRNLLLTFYNFVKNTDLNGIFRSLKYDCTCNGDRKCYDDEIKGYRFLWMSSNIFQGPAQNIRKNDPCDKVEPFKPSSFNDDRWKTLMELYRLILGVLIQRDLKKVGDRCERIRDAFRHLKFNVNPNYDDFRNVMDVFGKVKYAPHAYVSSDWSFKKTSIPLRSSNKLSYFDLNNKLVLT